MRSFPNPLPIVVSFAFLTANAPVESPAQATNIKISNGTTDQRWEEARDRFDRAIAAAYRELDKREAPVLMASLTAWVDWGTSTHQAELARADRDNYERAVYQVRLKMLKDNLADKRLAHAQYRADAERMADQIKAGESVQEKKRSKLVDAFEKSILNVEEAETELAIFEKYHGPRRRQQLIDEAVRAAQQATEAWSKFEAQRKRLQFRTNTIIYVNTSGFYLFREILRDFSKHTIKIATPSRSPVHLEIGDGRTHPSSKMMQNRDVARFFRDLLMWYYANMALSTSMLATP